MRFAIYVLLLGLSTGCTPLRVLPGGRTVRGSYANYYHDSLRLHLQDWGSSRLQVTAPDSTARTMWRLGPAARHAPVLVWSEPYFRSIPVHRLLVLRPTQLPPHWQQHYHTVSSAHGSWYYRRVDQRAPALFEVVYVADGQPLLLALQIAAQEVGGGRTPEQYLLEDMALILASVRSGAQYSPFQPLDPFQVAAEAFGNPQTEPGNYLLPLGQLRRRLPETARTTAEGSYWQALATYYSFLGALDSARAYMYRPTPRAAVPPTVRQDLDHLPQLRRTPAAPEVIRRAAAHHFLLLNEAHTQPEGRYFAGTLLPGLWAVGYRYLAVEALAEDSLLQHRGFPTLTSGFYTREPTLATLLREALALGFQLVAYDALSPDREQAQARNLLAKTSARDSAARVVVLAGHGHIDEGKLAGKSFAQWLHALTQQKPLTVSQTDLSQFPAPEAPAGAYLYWTAEGQPWQPASRGLTVDLYVHNRWAQAPAPERFPPAQGRVVSLTVPADSLLPRQEHVLHIYRCGEVAQVPNPVPVCVRPLNPATLHQQVILPVGCYRVQLWDQLGHVLWRRELTVKE